MDMYTTKALEYLLESYRQDLEHYQAVIAQHERYIKNCEKNIAELEAELKERGE